jgi:hypothetical protein
MLHPTAAASAGWVKSDTASLSQELPTFSFPLNPLLLFRVYFNTQYGPTSCNVSLLVYSAFYLFPIVSGVYFRSSMKVAVMTAGCVI